MSDRPRPTRQGPSSWVSADASEDERRPPLSRPRLVRAALRLVDERGLAALTMRALANELQVSPMALYNHVRDKDELTDLLIDLMLGEVDCSATEGDWLDQLRVLVCRYHRVLAAHPNLVRAYSNEIHLGPHSLMVMEQAIGLLLQAGFSAADAADAFFALYTYTVGFHQMGRAAPLAGSPPESNGTTGYYAALPAERIPALVSVGRHLNRAHGTAGFEYGLEVFLAGLRAKLGAG